MSDLTDVLETLHSRRACHVAALAEHQTALELIDKAIESLTALAGSDVVTPHPRERRAVITTKSVLQHAVDLANESPKAWAADEIIAEYEHRGTPITVRDPRNAMFSALSRASLKGQLVRVGHGRYVAPQFAELPEFDDRAPARQVDVDEKLPADAVAFPSYDSPDVVIEEEPF